MCAITTSELVCLQCSQQDMNVIILNVGIHGLEHKQLDTVRCWMGSWGYSEMPNTGQLGLSKTVLCEVLQTQCGTEGRLFTKSVCIPPPLCGKCEQWLGIDSSNVSSKGYASTDYWMMSFMAKGTEPAVVCYGAAS